MKGLSAMVARGSVVLMIWLEIDVFGILIGVSGARICLETTCLVMSWSLKLLFFFIDPTDDDIVYFLLINWLLWLSKMDPESSSRYL